MASNIRSKWNSHNKCFYPNLCVQYSHKTNSGSKHSGIKYALAAGFFCALAYYGLDNALNFGKASIVVPFTGLYPIIIIMVFIFLDERISLYQGIGVVLAIIVRA